MTPREVWVSFEHPGFAIELEHGNQPVRGQDVIIPSRFPGFLYESGDAARTWQGKIRIARPEAGLNDRYSGTTDTHLDNLEVNSVHMKGYNSQ